MSCPEVIIVGSGPSGVSAAWPLTEAGIEVLMLDAALEHPLPQPPTGNIGQFRRDPNRWKIQLGEDLGGLFVVGDYSPKLSTPLARRIVSSFFARSGLITNNFVGVGSYEKGGLSTIWGANAAVYDDDDLAGFPISRCDLLPSYQSVIRRIGVSGNFDADLGIENGPALTAPAAHVLQAYKNAIPAHGFHLARANNAVLTTPRADRQACAACGLCLWGCERRSIYTSVYDVASLSQRSNFTYRPRAVAQAVAASVHGPVIFLDGGERIAAPCVILATGTLTTSALVLRYLKKKSAPLLTNPVGAMAFVVPRLIGVPLPDESFSLAQLSYQIQMETALVSGAIYGSDTLPLTEIANRLPFSRSVALKVSRALAPAVLLATSYLPGEYSANTLSVGDDAIIIDGGHQATSASLLKRGLKQLSKHVRRMGAYPIFGSLTLSTPGADLHYAGTLPMGGAEVSIEGAVRDCPGLYVVDGAVLPSLPARHCTLTIMANADRIARRIAIRLRDEP